MDQRRAEDKREASNEEGLGNEIEGYWKEIIQTDIEKILENIVIFSNRKEIKKIL